MEATLILSNLICAIVSAKWALDLKYSPTRQLLFGIGGLIFGPIMLGVLYAIVYHKEYPHPASEKQDYPPIYPMTPMI